MNPFRKHFWMHCWGRWSDPYDGTFNYTLNGRVIGRGKGLLQSRVCRVCGKVETIAI